MSRVICLSDLHLDVVTHGVPRLEEIDRAVMNILGDVKEGDDVVVLGDITDPGGNRSYPAIARAIAYDREAKARGARHVFWMVGNHDVLEDGSGLSVLEPLRESGATVISKPWATAHHDRSYVFLPHAPLAARYTPESFLDEQPFALPTIVFGHLNPPGISPGSEASVMPRGRDVMWPDVAPKDRALYVGGHIHRAQVYETPLNRLPIEIVGSPVCFDFGEADHVPQTCVISYDREAGWIVKRKPLESRGVKLRRFIDLDAAGDSMIEIRRGDFVRATKNEDNEKACKYLDCVFVPLPVIAEGRPKASVSEGAKKHRRVRDVVMDVARAYPSSKTGLLDRVEATLTGVGL